jgi:hypothetical protein
VIALALHRDGGAHRALDRHLLHAVLRAWLPGAGDTARARPGWGASASRRAASSRKSGRGPRGSAGPAG